MTLSGGKIRSPNPNMMIFVFTGESLEAGSFIVKEGEDGRITVRVTGNGFKMEVGPEIPVEVVGAV